MGVPLEWDPPGLPGWWWPPPSWDTSPPPPTAPPRPLRAVAAPPGRCRARSARGPRVAAPGTGRSAPWRMWWIQMWKNMGQIWGKYGEYIWEHIKMFVMHVRGPCSSDPLKHCWRYRSLKNDISILQNFQEIFWRRSMWKKLESRRRRTKGSVVGEEWCQNAAPLRWYTKNVFAQSKMILCRAWLHDTVSCAAWNDARKGVY